MKNKFRITNIEWIDKDTKEASVTFYFNGNTYSFFSHPCDFKIGGNESMELSALVFGNPKSRIIYDKNVNCFLKVKNNDDWSYHGIGKIISLSPLLIDFDGIVIDLEDEVNSSDLSVGLYLELDIG